jgi:hypothetical protein
MGVGLGSGRSGVSWAGVSVGGSDVGVSVGSDATGDVGVLVGRDVSIGSGVGLLMGAGVSLGGAACVGAMDAWLVASVSGVAAAPQAVNIAADNIRTIESCFTLSHLLAIFDHYTFNYITLQTILEHVSPSLTPQS